MPGQSNITSTLVASAVRHHLPGRTIVNIEDRGVWIRHNFRITLDSADVVFLKVDQSFPASEKEGYICELLRSNELPAPLVLAVDTTCTILPAPFIIQEHVGGERLGDLLDRVSLPDRIDIYKALGRFYRKMHGVHHDHSGWIQGAGEVLPFSPTEHQYHEVILKIGAGALEHGLLRKDQHSRLKQLWSDSLEWLDEHKPSLVAGTLPWAVYLAKIDGWQVSKIMDLSDLLYWDPAWDLTIVKHPPFKAALGNYQEPESPENARWKEHVWAM